MENYSFKISTHYYFLTRNNIGRHRSREGVKLGTLNDPIRKFISVAGPEDIGIFTKN